MAQVKRRTQAASLSHRFRSKPQGDNRRGCYNNTVQLSESPRHQFLNSHLVQLARILKLLGQGLPSADYTLENMRLAANPLSLLAIIPEIAGRHLLFEDGQLPLFAINVKDTLPTGGVVFDNRRYFLQWWALFYPLPFLVSVK